MKRLRNMGMKTGPCGIYSAEPARRSGPGTFQQDIAPSRPERTRVSTSAGRNKSETAPTAGLIPFRSTPGRKHIRPAGDLGHVARPAWAPAGDGLWTQRRGESRRQYSGSWLAFEPTSQIVNPATSVGCRFARVAPGAFIPGRRPTALRGVGRLNPWPAFELKTELRRAAFSPPGL